MLKISSLLYVTLLLTLFHGHKPMAQQLINPSEIVLHIGNDEASSRNSEGAFIELKNGELLFAYSKFESGTGDFESANIVGRHSKDNGKTWSTSDKVILENEGGVNIMSVSFLRLKDGSIAMFYLRKNSKDDCMPFMRLSYDEANSWSAPEKIIKDKEGYFVLNNDRVVQLESGRLLAPVSLHKTNSMEYSTKGRIFCYYSDDNGTTWTSSQEVPNPDGVVIQEPGVLELKNGEVIMWMRTDAGVQYLSKSMDQGEGWEEVMPSSIISPRSPASLKRIPSTQDLLLVWNENLSKDKNKAALRTPLTAAISKDEGKTWVNVKQIENDPEGFFCYTAINFVGDNVLLGYMAALRNELNSSIPLVVRKLPLNEFYK